MTVVALVPAFRRADRVGATAAALLPLVDEVVVVDDGSADGGATIEAARRAGARVVALPANRGKGGAVAAAVAASPGAAIYLLVDADTAATAAATAPLLAAVAAGADLAIGILPPAGGRGGLGAVRRLARAGIARACGLATEAPLSGQRAVRGELLRSLEPADRFGLEAGMTIDAVRAGAVVVEVPVAVDHAHTGRTVAGFAHRGAQGFDLVRALWPRLLGERARLVLLLGGAVALVAVLAASAALRGPRGAPLGRAERVILVAAPAGLRLGDLDDPARPELAALAGRRGAVAAANVDVADRSPWSAWATVGAGRKLEARAPATPIDPSQPFLVQDRVKGAGRLGDALRDAGRTTAFVGGEVTSPVRLAVADGTGRIDRGASTASLGVAGLANRTRADATAGASVVAVDAGGLDGAGLEELLRRLRGIDPGRTLLLLVTPADPEGPPGLRPLVASGPGAPAGRLLSPSTRRTGLVLLSDIGPTILDVLGVAVPASMVGRPLQQVAAPSGATAEAGVGDLVEADRLARQRDSLWNRAFVAFGFLQAGALGWAGLRWWAHRRRGGVHRAAVGGDPGGGVHAAAAPAEGAPAGATTADGTTAGGTATGGTAAGGTTVGATTAGGTTTGGATAGDTTGGGTTTGGTTTGGTTTGGTTTGGATAYSTTAGGAAADGTTAGSARAWGTTTGGTTAAGATTGGTTADDTTAGGTTAGGTTAGRTTAGGTVTDSTVTAAAEPADGTAVDRTLTDGTAADGATSPPPPADEPDDRPAPAAAIRRDPGSADPWDRAPGPWLSWFALALVGWPLATWLTRALPGTGTWGGWAGLAALALDVAVVAAAWRLGRRRGLAPLAVVVAATLALVTVDLGLGGGLQVSSAFGGPAHTTGRFTGLGNVAFAVYAACATVAVACARRRAPWMVALLVVVALVDALPSLGADVGGVVSLVPVFVVTIASLWARLRVRTLVVAAAATAAMLGTALAADLSRPDDRRTHLGRFVAGGGQTSSIGGKLAQNLTTYAVAPILALVVLVTLGFALALWRGRVAALLPPGTPARIGVAASLAVALLGNVVNDSGAIVTVVALTVLAPYLVARVAAREPGPRHLPPVPAPTRTGRARDPDPWPPVPG